MINVVIEVRSEIGAVISNQMRNDFATRRDEFIRSKVLELVWRQVWDQVAHKSYEQLLDEL